MAKKTAPLLPTSAESLVRLGERLRTARLRRKLSAKQVAERAGMAPMTLRSVERGGAGVTMGAYVAVMQVLGIEKDLDLLGKADPLGRELQDARLPGRRGATREAGQNQTPAAPWGEHSRHRRRGLDDHSTGKSATSVDENPEQSVPIRDGGGWGAVPSDDTGDWRQREGFVSADALAGLIDPSAIPKPKGR